MHLIPARDVPFGVVMELVYAWKGNREAMTREVARLEGDPNPWDPCARKPWEPSPMTAVRWLAKWMPIYSLKEIRVVADEALQERLILNHNPPLDWRRLWCESRYIEPSEGPFAWVFYGPDKP